MQLTDDWVKCMLNVSLFILKCEVRWIDLQRTFIYSSLTSFMDLILEFSNKILKAERIYFQIKYWK